MRAPSATHRAIGFAALLLVLLAALATLQYRWAGQVSDGERERMRNGLRARAMQLAQDFDRELTRAMLVFQATPDAIIAKPGETLTDRFAQWTASAAYPQLVSDVYLFERLPGGSPTLARLDRASRTLQPSSWPEALRPVRDHFAARLSAPSSSTPALPLWPDVLDDSIPALLLPLVDVKVSREGGGEIRRLQTFDPSSACRLVIVVLDREAIGRTVLPALASRYFAGQDGFDYHLAVIDRASPPRVIYASDAWNPNDRAKPDLATGIMDIRFEDVPGLAAMASPLVPNSAGVVTHFDRFALTIVRRPKSGEATLLHAGPTDAARWQLVLRHRSGSLETAVQRSRVRNLVLSFGVLVLLALASAMVLVSAERARRLAAQQVEFVAGVSHELRTPVSVICSAAENLADGVIGDGQQVRRYGNLIRDEGRRLADMLERVLELAGVMSGRTASRFVPSNAGSIVDEAIETLRTEIDGAGMAVERTIAPNLPPIVADPPALRSAVQNLVANALKYRGAARTMRVTAGMAADAIQPTLEIVVADSGVGIDPEDLPHVFDPFYRGRAAAAGQVRGTGVGLTVVKRIVEAHGGTVTASSEPGRGSTFTIRLPARMPLDADATAAGHYEPRRV
jgi:signal transduction histidine kinase